MNSPQELKILEKFDYAGIYLVHRQEGYFENGVKYELNQKLFQIHEPYLMKNEREAFMKLEEKSSFNSKRKRSLFKKMNLIQVNLNVNEFKIVDELLKDCLQDSYSESNKSLFSGDDSNISKFDHLMTKSKALLSQLTSSKCQSNQEAQDFVSQLFRNRFQASNYAQKVYANLNKFSIKHCFGFVEYIIPSNCSFSSKDITQGIVELREEIGSGNVQVVNSQDPFFIVMDPAWENKSVKRLKTYDIVDREYLDKLNEEIKRLINVILEKSSPQKRISCSIWTTEAELNYTLKNILPTIELKPRFVLKWHKITTQGCPVKIHGGLEYLVIADNDPTSIPDPKNGILISIPSAIHSHKPPLFSIWNWLYGTDFDVEKPPSFSSSEKESILQESKILSPLKGVELFARYLNSGFHSIGNEAVHLNAENVFTCAD